MEPSALQGFSNLEFLKIVDAVILGVLMLEAPQSLVEGDGLRRNYRFVLQLVIVMLFAELFIIQQTYHATLSIPYSQGALTFDLFALALPFVCLSRLITASFKKDENFKLGVWVFGGIFLLLLVRQLWFIYWNPAACAATLPWLFVPIGFDAVGLVICSVGVKQLDVTDKKERDRRRNGWAKSGLVLLALYFLFSRLLKGYSNPVVAGYRSLIVTLGLVFSLAIADLARKPDTEVFVFPALFKWARRLCFVPLGWCTWIIFLDGSRPGVTEILILVVGGVGALLTAWGKYALDDQHAWAGQHQLRPMLIRRGPYKKIRHPMYTGIVIFMVAGILVLATAPASQRFPWAWGTGLCVGVLLFLMWYVVYVAGKETELLAKDCPEFTEYKNGVHAWNPFAKPGQRRDPPDENGKTGGAVPT